VRASGAQFVRAGGGGDGELALGLTSPYAYLASKSMPAFVCPSAGAWLLQHAKELANEVRSTLTQLLHAIGLLNAKVQTEERLAVAQRHIIMALVAVECHLPCSELDMKLHLLLHGPRRILGAGPLGSISMLQWESLWGVLAPYASNKRHPEVSMLRGCCDAQRAMLVRERTNGVLGHAHQTTAVASELPPHPWQLGASESAAAAAVRGGSVAGPGGPAC